MADETHEQRIERLREDLRDGVELLLSGWPRLRPTATLEEPIRMVTLDVRLPEPPDVDGE